MAELDLDDLGVFVRVVERGGFAAAARELGTPTSTVSRAIARLEAKAAVRLFQRTTRAMRTTTEGRELFASVAPAVTTLRAAARSLETASHKPRGRLRVTAANDLAANFLSGVIVGFMETHPLVQLEFALTNQHTRLVDEGFDVALRATLRLPDSSLIARKLGDLELRLYASPGYLDRHGAPASWSELEHHRLIVFRPDETARPWTMRGRSGEIVIPVRGSAGGDDFSFVRAIVQAGGGIGLLPHINCAADEASGRLVRVLPELHARGASLYLLTPSIKNVPARVTAFRDFVIDAYASWVARHRDR
jgi:DNA-binding transcriptional LysR family regulator